MSCSKTVSSAVGGWPYMETGEIGGLIMEVAQFPPDYDPKKGVLYEPT